MNALALQSDGKIVAAGISSNSTGYDFGLARYTRTGGLDSTFGTGGKVVTDFSGLNDAVNAVAIDADRRIVAAGYDSNASNGDVDFALARYGVTIVRTNASSVE